MDTIHISIHCKHAIDNALSKIKGRDKCGEKERYKWRAYLRDELGRQITVKWQPIGRGYRTQAYAKLELHLKEHSTFTELKEFVAYYFGLHAESVMNGQVSRLDLRVELDRTYQQIRSKIHYDNKRVSVKISENKESVYAGSKTSDNGIVIYEDDDDEAPAVIEVRHKKTAVPIRCLNDLPLLVEMNPFHQVHFSEIDITKKARIEHLQLMESFTQMVWAVGVLDALQRLPKKSPKKLVKTFLKEVDKELIPNAWKAQLDRFFEGKSPEDFLMLKTPDFKKKYRDIEKKSLSEFCTGCLEYDGTSSVPAIETIKTIESIAGVKELFVTYGDKAEDILSSISLAMVNDMNPLGKKLKKLLSDSGVLK